MPARTVTFGELMLRLTPPGFERLLQSPTLHATFGGGEANVAASLASLGLPAAFVTILMIVGNTMVMSVRERTSEIGVLKTLGFSGGRILRMVLGESILLALLGGLPGLGVALLLITGVRDSLMSFVPALSLYPDIAAAAVGLMVVFGIITGLVPALSAMRLNIVTALGRS